MIELGPSVPIALIITLGIAAQWLAWRVSLPAILPLLVIGFFVGPVLGILNPNELFGEELLFPLISLAVGLILFEGGLTLRIPEVRETSRVVFKLVTVGALITWAGATAAAYWIVGLPMPLSFLFGALVIVTGPTVIGPLLRIVRPATRIANVLKWEGILVDVVGAMVAVLVFEFLLIRDRSDALGQTVLFFLRFIGVGTLVGLAGGYLLATLLRRRTVPDYLVNVVALAFVFAMFALSNTFAPESGLLATALMGIIIANRGVPNITTFLSFKEDLTLLFISLLFIILAANVQLEAFVSVLDLRSVLLIAALMLVIRPLAIFASSVGSALKTNEKLYLSWIAPRGIVAAAVSSLFASELAHEGFAGAEVLVPLVFLVIVSTVTLNSLTAKPFARLLKVAEPEAQGFLILGAHSFARRIGTFLQTEGLTVTLADTNWSNVSASRMEGLNAYYGSLLSDHSDDEVRLAGIGKFLALTSNDEANALAALKYAREFDSDNVYQLAPGRGSNVRGRLGDEQGGRTLFKKPVTYAELSSLFNRGGELKKTPITDAFRIEDFEQLYGQDYLPMFVLSGKTVRVMIEGSPPPEPGQTLVSLVLEPKSAPLRAERANA